MSTISVYGYNLDMLATIHGSQEDEDLPSSGCRKSGPLLPNGSNSLFLGLPYEIRAMIYNYVMPWTNSIGQWHRADAPVWATCRKIHDETISLLYGDCTFPLVVNYGDITFHHQWLNTWGANRHRPLTPRRVYQFPDIIPLRYRTLLRRIHVRISLIDGYEGMIKYNCSNRNALALGVRDQVQTLCNTLQDIPEIQDLLITWDIKRIVDCELLRLVTEPFQVLRNLRSVTVQDIEGLESGCVSRIQAQVAHASIKNFKKH
ncbi:hypothetical protein ACLMJK_002234 [Lecanora helva]